MLEPFFDLDEVGHSPSLIENEAVGADRVDQLDILVAVGGFREQVVAAWHDRHHRAGEGREALTQAWQEQLEHGPGWLGKEALHEQALCELVTLDPQLGQEAFVPGGLRQMKWFHEHALHLLERVELEWASNEGPQHWEEHEREVVEENARAHACAFKPREQGDATEKSWSLGRDSAGDLRAHGVAQREGSIRDVVQLFKGVLDDLIQTPTVVGEDAYVVVVLEGGDDVAKPPSGVFWRLISHRAGE